MYHKLARGYATAYLEKLQTYDAVEDWFEGRRCIQAITSFEQSAQSKKAGRCAKRLVPFLKPVFQQPRVGFWTRGSKLAISQAVSAAPESRVFDLDETTRPIFSERSAFLSNLFLGEVDGEFDARLLTVANISHHALARIVERELVVPEKLALEARNILGLTRNLAMTFSLTDLDQDEAYAFLLPYKGGALPVVTMRISADSREASENRWIMSVRTFLTADMLKQSDHERMGGFHEATALISSDGSSEAISRWMEENARPWTLAAADNRNVETPALL